MDFNEFTDKIVELLKQKVGDTSSVMVTETLKNNGVRLKGIVIMEDGRNVSPTVYLEEPYQQYQDGVSLEEILEEIMEEYEKHAHDLQLDMDFFRDFSQVKDRIFHKVISYEKNEELLKDVPYFKWHDLAVVFYYEVEKEIFEKATILIHNSHLDMWGQPAEEIYRIARQNMKEKMPELLMPMQKVLEEMAGISVGESGMHLYVLTNKERMFGASAMLYSEEIKGLADKLHTDLLILPSSLHEVLLLPDDHVWEYDSYRKMVKEVNTTQVDPEEILSFSLYRYNREKDEIEEIEKTAV